MSTALDVGTMGVDGTLESNHGLPFLDSCSNFFRDSNKRIIFTMNNLVLRYVTDLSHCNLRKCPAM